jgi:hypothetical protein
VRNRVGSNPTLISIPFAGCRARFAVNNVVLLSCRICGFFGVEDLQDRSEVWNGLAGV